MEFNLILKKLQNNLTPEEETEFNDWLHASEENKVYFQKVQRNFHSEAPIKADPDKAWKKIAQKTSPTNYRHWIYSAAAAILVIFLISYDFSQEIDGLPETQVVSEEKALPEEIIFTDQYGETVSLDRKDQVVGSYYTAEGEKMKVKGAAQAIGTNSIYVPKGRIFNLELSDGTIVHLNSDSEFSFPSSFEGSDRREVHLIRGEAYFEVTPSRHNENKAFVVVNSGQKIEVIGTEFNVKAYEGEPIATTLAEGKISLRTEATKVFLSPGEQSVVNRGNPSIEVSKVNISEVISWKEGVFHFKDTSLKDLLKVLSRWYDVEIAFPSEGHLTEEKFNGVFSKKQDLTEILNIIESSNKVKFEINGKKINVTEYQK